jgi:uroporphyrinogen decarboxylase
MTPRERILAALNHRPTDVVPFDIGGTKTTSINVQAYDKLKAHLGMNAPTEFGHYRSQRTHMAEEMSRFFDSDVRRVYVPYPSPLPESVTRPLQLDEWGNEWTQSPTGLYFVTRPALENVESVSDLARHPFPEPASLVNVSTLAAAARKLRAETDCAICLDLPDGIVHQTQFLRGFDRWLLDSADNRLLFDTLLERVTEIYIAMVEPLLNAIGDSVDVVLHCDDIAMQSGPLINPRVYRQTIKPRQARIFRAIKAHTSAKLLFHSCGSMVWALGDLIEMGVDAVNPVQVSAAQMDTARLKREFGDKLCFWGAIDTQHVLPSGTPNDVRDEVRRRIDDLASGGGYVIGSVHIIQAEVPPQNILAMAHAAHIYGGRSDGSRFLKWI